MPRDLRHEELEDIIYGAAFLGAGGGGSPVQGLSIISQIKEEGKKVVLVSPDEVEDNALVVVSAGMGSPAAAKYGWRNEHIPAFKLLRDYLEKAHGEEVKYVVPLEIGAGNFAVPLHTAASSDIPLIDGDGAGRAIPELQLVSFDIYGIPISPMAITNWEGNGGILFVKDAEWAEKICRQIVVAFQGNAGIALYPMRGSDLKRSVIPNTVTLSQKVGAILRRVREENADIADLLSKELNAYILGVGKVREKTLETRSGFDFGKVVVETKEGDLEVYFKNENIIAKLNEKILAMAPDLICWTTTDGRPLTNVDVEKGLEVVVVGLRAHERLRTEKALKAFEHLYGEVGFDVKYKPIEELME